MTSWDMISEKNGDQPGGSPSRQSNYARMQQKAREKRMAAAKRGAADKIISDLARQGKAEKNQKKPKSEYQKYLDAQLEFKKQKYKDQQKSQVEKIKGKARKDKKESDAKVKERLGKAKSALKTGFTPQNRINSQMGGASAVQAGMENVGGMVKGLAKGAFYGARALSAKRKGDKDMQLAKSRLRSTIRKQRDAKKKEPGQPGRPRSSEAPAAAPAPSIKGQLPGTSIKGALPPESKQKVMRRRLPPSSEGGTRVGQPAPGSKPQLPGSMKRRMLAPAGETGPTRTAKGTIGTSRVGQPATERPSLKPAIDKRRMLPPSSQSDGPARTAAGRVTLGSRARANPALRAKLTKERGGKTDFKKAKKKVLGLEHYSWRETFTEEFLSEVEKKSKKNTEEKIVDIMKGKNKVTIHPMEESHQKVSSGKMKDREGYMAHSQLDSMERAIAALRKKVKRGDDQLPAWVQSKITKAADYIDTASDYMQGNTMKEDLEEILAKKLLTEIDKSKMKCNKPKAQAVGDSLTGKSHVVKACSNGQEKIIRFGQRGVKGSPKKKGESKEYASRRKRFKTRHAKNIAKGKMSAAYWANRVKW